MAILITRPSPYGDKLAALLCQHGLEAYHTPLIDFLAGDDLMNLPQQLARLTPGDSVIVVSQQAIFYAKRTLIRYAACWPAYVHYFAIGRNSARALQQLIPYQINVPSRYENSEHLLQLPILQHVENKNILILQGNQSRPLIAKTLTHRGAVVWPCQCYRRYFIDYQETELVMGWQKKKIDTFIVTSAELLQRLHQLIAPIASRWLLNCQLIVISDRIACLAQALGWQKIIVATGADNDTLLTTSQQLFTHRTH